MTAHRALPRVRVPVEGVAQGAPRRGASARHALARGVAPLALALRSAPADAHLNATGMGPVYDGLAHFFASPEDLVPALALALLAGLRGAEHGRRALCALPIAWLAGILLGTTAALVNTDPVWAALWFVALGGLVVADAKVSLRMMTALCALLGLAHGYVNGTGLGLSATAVVAALGLASAVFVLTVLVAALVVSLRAAWARIAVRVGGSWIAASGILMLGWSLRAG